MFSVTEIWNVLAIQTKPKGSRIVNEDRAFFLQPVKQENRILFEARLNLGEEPNKFKLYNTTRRRLSRFADYSGLELLDETQSVQIMNKNRNYIVNDLLSTLSGVSSEKRFIKTQSMREIFKDKYSVNQPIFDSFTIIWIEDNGDVIIEFHNMNYTLFRTNSDGLSRLVQEAFFMKLAEIGQQVLSFVLVLFEAVGLVADIVTAVITAGAGAGFRKIIFEFVINKVQQLGVDTALDIAGVKNQGLRFAAHIGVDFSKILAQGLINRGISSRKLTISSDKPSVSQKQLSPAPKAEPPKAPLGESPKGPKLPDDFEEGWSGRFEAEGPMVIGPGTGKPLNVLEIGAGQAKIYLGIPDDPVVALVRSDVDKTLPVDRIIDAQKRLNVEYINQFDTIIINNPHGYIPNLEYLAPAVRPGGRIIIQGDVVHNRAFRTTILSEPPSGFKREIDFSAGRDLPPSDPNPKFAKKSPAQQRILQRDPESVT